MTASSMFCVAVAALLLVGCAPRAVVSDGEAPPSRPTRTSARTGQTAPVSAALVVPVEGVTPERLRDSYTAERSGGRMHRALDIAAPLGTPVVAAAAGTVRQMKESTLGGITAVVVTHDGRTVHYYAHLDRYADDLYEGQSVRAGQRLGYVGTTGNAQGPHLHFAAWRIADEARFWEGEVFNPFPLFHPDPPTVADAERSSGPSARQTAPPRPPARPLARRWTTRCAPLPRSAPRRPHARRRRRRPGQSLPRRGGW